MEPRGPPWWARTMGPLPWKTVWRFLERLNTANMAPSDSTLALCPRETKTHVHTNTCSQTFTAA